MSDITGSTSDRNEFTSYLETSGVTDLIEKLLAGLYREFEDENCDLPLDYGINLGLPTESDIKIIKKKINDARVKHNLPPKYTIE